MYQRSCPEVRLCVRAGPLCEHVRASVLGGCVCNMCTCMRVWNMRGYEYVCMGVCVIHMCVWDVCMGVCVCVHSPDMHII